MDHNDRFVPRRPAPLPDLRPRPPVVSPQELAQRCRRSLDAREVVRLTKENERLKQRQELAGMEAAEMLVIGGGKQ